MKGRESYRERRKRVIGLPAGSGCERHAGLGLQDLGILLGAIKEAMGLKDAV